jgi:hypothetical protein
MSETVIKQSSEFSTQKTTLAIAILPFRCESHTMECLHGKTASYNLLEFEGIYANAVAHEVQRLCVESCNGCQVGHLSQGQHDCLVMNENERWQMYGFHAIERVNAKRMVWCEFAEATRVLKLRVERDVLEHLQQLEKDPDSTFVDHSLMELHQNTENHELQCILNYLFHLRLEDPLESAAEAFFSCPPSYMYSVKATSERFRSFDADHKIAYQGFLEKKLVEQFNKQS